MKIAEQQKEGAEYNKIGNLFKRYEGAPAHQIQTRTILDLTGDVTDKSILDLACGYGFFGRELHKRGASKVVGVDISEEMIKLAKEESKKNNDKIEFYVGDVAEMEAIDRFDIAIAAFLFNYAPTLSDLKNMFKAVSKNLKPNGKLIAYTVEPDFNLQQGNFSDYGVHILGEEPFQEGHRMQAEFASSSTPFTFYRWQRKDYEQAITEAGFSNFYWHKPHLSKADIEKHQQGFWDTYQNNCFHTALVCEL